MEESEPPRQSGMAPVYHEKMCGSSHHPDSIVFQSTDSDNTEPCIAPRRIKAGNGIFDYSLTHPQCEAYLTPLKNTSRPAFS